MLKRFRSAVMMTCLLSVFIAAVPVNAGFFDRIKEIYNTPEKISELEAQYLEAKAALDEQQEELEQSRIAAEEYARKQQELAGQNEQYRLQNEQLIARNAGLQSELERMKSDRESFTDMLFRIAAIVAALAAAYYVSLRLWRYSVWRRQRSDSGRSFGG
ncbi:hypothetical protein KP806_13605 [Paenibacillus sp. N4]|uniref:hypothetical protein n=1 Tax=Paenibacillus vietnamensis TaxID=2590547 RepID=UPI001CD124F3|nr:hypothetical protein [Paenibacillus vietnamensis]MCA0756087.1 hypothetical protein [Paenibacillus vietnamensis]